MALQAFEVPLTPEPQRFAIQLGGNTYIMRFTWCAPAACWMFDLLDAAGALLVGSIPVVTGNDLLGQYAHLGIQGSLIVQTDYNPDAPPTFANLGVTGRVYFVAAA